jgi:hypothetical protein
MSFPTRPPHLGDERIAAPAHADAARQTIAIVNVYCKRSVPSGGPRCKLVPRQMGGDMDGQRLASIRNGTLNIAQVQLRDLAGLQRIARPRGSSRMEDREAWRVSVRVASHASGQPGNDPAGSLSATCRASPPRSPAAA